MNISQQLSHKQKKLAFFLYFGCLYLVFGAWILPLYVINIFIPYNTNYMWLAYIPMLFILIGLICNRSISYDWMTFYSISLSLGLLCLAISIIFIFLYFSFHVAIIINIYILISYVIVFIIKYRSLNFKAVKQHFLKYNIDKEKAIYAPKLNNADCGPIYKSNNKNTFFDKIENLMIGVILILQPILVVINITENSTLNLTLIGGAIFTYLLSVFIGIYAIQWSYIRLKCLYEIQKELGRTLTFG